MEVYRRGMLHATQVWENETELDDEELFYDIDYFNDNLYESKSGFLLSTVDYTSTELLVGTRIDRDILFKYAFPFLSGCLQVYYNYLSHIRTLDPDSPIAKQTFALQIIQLHKVKTDYGFIEHRAIVKTHWLRLLQRHWRKVVAERRRILTIRGSLKEQQMRETCGEYSSECRSWPGAKGMLACYANNNRL